jgi:hypothetical protein
MGQQTSLFLVSHRQAATLLQRAEDEDGYLAACAAHPANAAARRGYHTNRIPPALEERLTDALQSLRLPRRLQMGRIPVVHLHPSSDGGMPHSRPNMVCVPHLEQIHSEETMIHELWHVHQRRYQKEWAVVFAVLGWRPWRGDLPAGLEKHRRINPDTVDAPLWIFEETWVAVPLFRDVVSPDLREADVWFYDVRDGRRTRTVPAGLLEWFPSLPPSAYEHPRELAAYTLAAPERYQGTKGFQVLVEHLGQGAVV